MDTQAVRTDTISEQLATLAGATSALEAAIETTDEALQATSTDELSAAIRIQSQAATRTLTLKNELRKSFPDTTKNNARLPLQEQIQAHPDADTLLPLFESIEQRLKAGRLKLSQQAQVVNKMQMINQQLLGLLVNIDKSSYNQQGNQNDGSGARVIAKA